MAAAAVVVGIVMTRTIHAANDEGEASNGFRVNREVMVRLLWAVFHTLALQEVLGS